MSVIVGTAPLFRWSHSKEAAGVCGPRARQVMGFATRGVPPLSMMKSSLVAKSPHADLGLRLSKRIENTTGDHAASS
jgi:hypothetical protein